MSFLDIIRNMFGDNQHRSEPKFENFQHHNLYKNNYKNPNWQPNGTDDYLNNSRNFDIQVMVTDINDLAHLIESQGRIMRNFFGSSPVDDIQMTAEYGTGDVPKQNLRDYMLKNPHRNNHNAYEGRANDRRFDANTVFKPWNEQERQPPPSISFLQPHVSSYGGSVQMEVVRKSDGTVEQRRIIRDTDGNEETIISKQIGDKKHMVSIKKDKNGAETRTEDLINMNQEDLQLFDARRTPTLTKNENNEPNKRSILNLFSWKRLFEPDPKL